MRQTNEALLAFIEESPTSYHVVENLSRHLLEGFERLDESSRWHLEPGRGYYVTRNGSSIIAFRMPDGHVTGFQMAAAHTDAPLLKLKPHPEMEGAGAYVKLNVEKYGGLLCAPWLDRPLSIAGRVAYRTECGITTTLVDLKRPVALIPNLAIHMDPKANTDHTYHAQTDLLPLIGMADVKGKFMEHVADAAGCDPDDILSSDLFCYNAQPGTIWGLENDFVSSRSLDDLQCAWSCMQAFVQAPTNHHKVTLCALFDNEEVGSGTKQGADSTFLADTLVRINDALGNDAIDLANLLTASFAVSADNAHGVHPNHPEVADPTNRPILNKGIVIKHSANQKYTTDAISSALFELVCERAGVPTQSFANHSDKPGGSTLGNIATSHVSVNTVDVGLAQLAMHSPFETAGAHDTDHLVRAMTEYFACAIDPDGRGGYVIS